ncbi:unnamed protein product [Caenorhabditis auriculariae]|uniref:Uncharacterized protein n=1 Tax=Caenorhabditis auriculariae TaxID=2777116 RepID=A0A8S1HEV9_9PELO|nr:unnamed protein product [Caenorhabditis auriculariae]
MHSTVGVLLAVVLSAVFADEVAEPFFNKRELAPSLALDRLNALRDSIAKLQMMNQRVKCQLRERSRTKRMISPAMRLSELLDPRLQQQLVADPPVVLPEEDPCLDYYSAF